MKLQVTIEIPEEFFTRLAYELRGKAATSESPRTAPPPVQPVTRNGDRPLFVTVKEAAKMLSISRTKLYEMIYKEEIPSKMFGKSRRIPLTALERLLE